MSRKNNYTIAAIMVRHPIRKDLAVYSCSHVALGYFDEETGVFTDTHKNEYRSITDPQMINSAEPYGYNYRLLVEKLPELVGKGIALDEAATRYEEICKQDVVLVGQNDESIPYSTTTNIPGLLKELEEAIDESESKSTKKEFYIGENPSTVRRRFNRKEVEDITKKLIDGGYTLDELKTLYSELQEEFSDVEALAESIKVEFLARDTESLNPLTASMIESLQAGAPKPNYVYDPFEVKLTKQEKIDIEEVFKNVTKTLVAQDDAARRVIVEIARKEMDARKKQTGILLTGDTGVGKTLLMELIAKYIGRPFKKIDATQLTIPGYVGKNIEEELWDLYVKCGHNKKKAESAVIFIDEIDKKGSKEKSDVSGQGVLNVLLPFIEGAVYDASASSKSSDTKVKIDTSNMIVILGGAFTDVYKNLLEKNGVGFNSEVSSTPKQREAKVEDFVKYAMMPEEFMGRLTIIRLNPLTVEDIKRVLNESDASAINVQKKIFAKLGVRLTAAPGFIDTVAEEAIKRKTGARGLNSIVDEATWQAFDEVYTHPGEYEEVEITEETLENPKQYKKIKKENKASN